MDRCLREIEESLVSRAVESEVFATMASRSGRQEETGDRSRESRREADGHIDDFVSSPVGRRSPTTAAGPPERHRIASVCKPNSCKAAAGWSDSSVSRYWARSSSEGKRQFTW